MTFGKRTVLVVERFDRRWTANERLLRLPQEDCCQALSISPTQKYQSDGGPGIVQILQLLRGSDDPLSDQRAFLKANIVFWLMGATDGHAKNFSVFLRPGGRFRLTPLYDVISAQPSVDSKQVLWKNFRHGDALWNQASLRNEASRSSSFFPNGRQGRHWKGRRALDYRGAVQTDNDGDRSCDRRSSLWLSWRTCRLHFEWNQAAPEYSGDRALTIRDQRVLSMASTDPHLRQSSPDSQRNASVESEARAS